MKRKAIPVSLESYEKLKKFRDYLLIEKRTKFKNYGTFLEWMVEELWKKLSEEKQN